MGRFFAPEGGRFFTAQKNLKYFFTLALLYAILVLPTKNGELGMRKFKRSIISKSSSKSSSKKVQSKPIVAPKKATMPQPSFKFPPSIYQKKQYLMKFIMALVT